MLWMWLTPLWANSVMLWSHWAVFIFLDHWQQLKKSTGFSSGHLCYCYFKQLQDQITEKDFFKKNFTLWLRLDIIINQIKLSELLQFFPEKLVVSQCFNKGLCRNKMLCCYLDLVYSSGHDGKNVDFNSISIICISNFVGLVCIMTFWIFSTTWK